VVESFRNDLYPGYKTSEGVPPELLSQFPLLEEALEAMGVLVWPMVDYEAADAAESALCGYMAWIALAGLVVNAIWNKPWADPIAALALTPLILREAWEAIHSHKLGCGCN
jgi:hypothetical protein